MLFFKNVMTFVIMKVGYYFIINFHRKIKEEKIAQIHHQEISSVNIGW